MTVSSIVPVNNYTGNSSVKKFDFDFLIEDASELIVQHTNNLEETKILTLGVDYSINEIGNPNGSYIIFPLDTSSYDVLSNDEKISLMLTLDIKQESEFKNSSYFNLNILEWTFDYIIRILQTLNRKIERSVKISEGASLTPDEIIKQIKTSEVNAIQAANVASEAKSFIAENEALNIVAEDFKGSNNISNVLDNKINIDKVANSISNVDAVGTNIENVNIVAANKDNINLTVQNETNINNCANNIADIKTAYKTAADSAIIAKKWAVSDDMVEDGLYSAKYYAQHVQGLSDVTYNDLRAVNAFESDGNILKNEEAYYDVLNNAHSTFDASNFTVVGSPVITENGVASGFTINDYIITNVKLSKLSNKSVIFRIKFIATADFINNPKNGVLASSADSFVILQVYEEDKRIVAYFRTNENDIENSHNIQNILPDDFEWKLNEEYIYEFKLVPYNYSSIKLITSDNKIYEKTLQNTNIGFLCESQNYIKLSRNIADFTFNGAIDLKTFEIIADGINVFNCNKTGIDIIKPDDYTVVGSPIISESGIVRNDEENNGYIKYIQKDYSSVKKIKFTSRFQCCTPMAECGLAQLPGLRIVIDSSLQIHLRGGVFDSYIAHITPSTKIVLNDGDWFNIDIEYTKTNLFAKVRKDDGTVAITNVEKDFDFGTSTCQLLTFFLSTTHLYKNGVIDLNSTKLYADDELIWQPSLKIPYTLTKTGSKIVDGFYRERVKDVYEQFGTAMYYTLDEENKNFTLPMGEIYGMIEQKADKTTVDNEISAIKQNKLNKNGSNAEFPYIVETYENAGSWYRLWSDGWCEQGGIFNPNQTNSWKNIELLKEMQGTDYAAFICNSGTSTTAYTVKIGDSDRNTTTTVAVLCSNNATAVRWQVKGFSKE